MEPVIDLTKEYGIVLEGGGAKGAYQIGAWKALKEAGVKIKGVAGTSVGALNGAFICMDDLKSAEHVWENITSSMVMEVDDEKMEKLMERQTHFGEAAGLFLEIFGMGGVDIEPLRKLIHDNIQEDVIRKSPVEFFAWIFNMDQMKEEEVNIKKVEPGRIEDYLLASASIFPLFKHEKIDGKRYVDNGAFNNVPLNTLIDREYQDIIVIRIYGIGRERHVKIPEGTVVHTVAPRVSLGNMLDFNAKKSRRNMKIGYYDTKRMLYGLSGTIYYIEENQEEWYYLRQLLSVAEEGMLRQMTEEILPSIARELKLSRYWTYRELYLAMLEATAKICKIPKYCIYTVEELRKKVCEKLREMEAEEDTLPVFVSFFKDQGGHKI